ncbi:MAG TPA: hypothetical protein VEQ59_16765, partial [Polyangiaceae bacterium]|nr:hypothetical protein [Polyangiaceae bacterium]
MGAMLCEGAGEKLRDIDGVTRTRGAGLALGRGSTRNWDGALERGALDQVERGAVDQDDDGSLRRITSRGAIWRVSGRTRLLRNGAAADVRNESRVAPAEVSRLPDKATALAGAEVRCDGMARAGTRAADIAGPRGAVVGAMRAGRAAGPAAVRAVGWAGARYGVG